MYLTHKYLEINAIEKRLFLAFVFVIKFPVSILGLDSFHFGEKVSLVPQLINWYDQHYSIHGLVDAIPNYLSLIFFGDDFSFFYTGFVDGIFSALATLLILAVFLKFCERNVLLYVSLGLLCIVSIEAKDFLYALLLFLLTSFQPKIFISFILGFVIAFSLLWSFNRGIVALCFLPYCFLYYDKRMLVSSFCLTLAILFSSDYLSLVSYISNIQFLLLTGSQWNLELTPILSIRSLSYLFNYFAVIFIVAVPIIMIVRVLGSHLKGDCFHSNKNMLFVSSILLASLIYAKIAFGRIDIGHMLMGIHAPLFAVVYLRWMTKNNNFYVYKYVLSYGAVIIGYFLAYYGFGNSFTFLILFSGLIVLNRRLSLNAFTLLPLFIYLIYFKSTLFTDPVINSQFVDSDVVEVSRLIDKEKNECILDLTNSGTFNGLLGLPSCTMGVYLAYYSKDMDHELVLEVKDKDIEVVIFSSSLYHFSFDGVSSHEKFPVLTNYIFVKFPFETCIGSYCIRSKSPL